MPSGMLSMLLLIEYQDHFDTDEDAEVLDNVGMKLQSLFGGV